LENILGGIIILIYLFRGAGLYFGKRGFYFGKGDFTWEIDFIFLYIYIKHQ